MVKRIAINGFGRIGRNFFRNAFFNDDIEIVYINDLFEPKFLAYALKYDSVYGSFKGVVEPIDKGLKINGKEIPITAEKDPLNLPHDKNDIEIVLESTGFFTARKDAKKHLEAGANKVLISAPAQDPDITVLLGCNDDKLKDEHKIVSNASCTTNGLGPLVKVLDDNFGITQGIMTTIHSYTSTQSIVDTAKSAKPIKMTRGRAAAQNIIPTSTGAAKAIGLIFPHLDGKLDGMAMRVPTVDGSIVDLKVNVSKVPLHKKDIDQKMKDASQGDLEGILQYTEDPIVSSDIIGNTHSSIYCNLWTNIIGNLVAVTGWYDNEYGYSSRLVDLIAKRL